MIQLLYPHKKLTLQGCAFCAFGTVVTAEQVSTPQKSYFKLGVRIAGRKYTFLVFEVSNALGDSLSLTVEQQVYVTGYVNLSYGYFLVLSTITLLQDEDFDSPLTQVEIITGVSGINPHKDFRKAFASRIKKLNRKASEQKSNRKEDNNE